jgi:Zn-dependent protease/predicted transcriptional regulator
MFGKKIPLFKLFGFHVGIDLSWFILAVLITWSLATGLFPFYFEGLTPRDYWLMGMIGAIGLFVSIIFHEFCHSLVARRFNLPMKGITLFVFGGVAEMYDEPQTPGAEFFMAIAGPISSLVLGGFFGILGWGLEAAGRGQAAWGVLYYLMWLNVILAVFNMIPAFPLDGGRVLRSILWKLKGNLAWATRIAAAFGSGFGIFLIVLGVLAFIGGSFISGAWYFLIGLFIRGASRSSYEHMVVRRALEGESVRHFMKTDPITVPEDEDIQHLVEDYFYRHHHKMYPVMEGDRLRGCVSTQEVKGMDRSEWPRRTVREIARPCTPENTVSPDMDAMEALNRMNRTGNSRLLVVRDDRLEGIVTLKDLLDFLAVKMDLEEGGRTPTPHVPRL